MDTGLDVGSRRRTWFSEMVEPPEETPQGVDYSDTEEPRSTDDMGPAFVLKVSKDDIEECIRSHEEQHNKFPSERF